MMTRHEYLLAVGAVGEAVHVHKGDGPRVPRRRFVMRGRERSEEHSREENKPDADVHGVSREMSRQGLT
jgi:hypothetical protein